MWSNPRIPYKLASDRKKLSLPDNKRIITNIVMNVEYWPYYKQMPRGILPPPHGKTAPPPDLPNFSWVEYGMRVGLSRCIDLLSDYKIPVSTFINAQVCDVYESAFEKMCKFNWEMVGHGWIQESMRVVKNEEEVIKKSLEKLRKRSGQKVKSWFGPGGGETDDTLEILKENNVNFVHDWVVDDLPCWIRTKKGPMVALPYTFELNDVPIWTIQNNSCDEMLKRIKATLEVFDSEKTNNVKILTIALHPHIVGVPQNFKYLRDIIELLISKKDLMFMTSTEIGEWFIETSSEEKNEIEKLSNSEPKLV